MNPHTLSIGEGRLWRRFQRYLADDQLIAAQASLEALIQRLPHEPLFRVQLGQVMLRRAQPQAATSQWLHVVETALPDEPWLLFELAQSLCHVGEVLAARTCLELLEQRDDVAAGLWSELARLRATLGEIAAAVVDVSNAIAAGSDTPDDHYLHATMLQFSGNLSSADAILDQCVQRWPFFGGAVMARASLRRQTPASNHVDFLLHQLQRFPTGAATPSDNLVRAEFTSAAFKELDDLGRHDEAWPALATSNALMHALNPYNAALETAVTDALLDDAVRRAGAAAAAMPSFNGPVPIFIVGMPRSGTTLLDRMLSNHSEVTSAGEITDFIRQLHWLADVAPGDMLQAIGNSPRIDCAELGQRYLQQTQWRAQGCKYYLDKLPANIQMVAFIRRALPHAPILHMVRDPMEVCFSNYRAMFGNSSAYSYAFATLAHYYGQYRRLADHWRITLPRDVLDVSYRALVSAPEACLRRVLEHCGLALEQACLQPEGNTAPVATPSNIQVREPIHTRSLEHWRHYEKHLKPLQAMIESLGQQHPWPC